MRGVHESGRERELKHRTAQSRHFLREVRVGFRVEESPLAVLPDKVVDVARCAWRFRNLIDTVLDNRWLGEAPGNMCEITVRGCNC